MSKLIVDMPMPVKEWNCLDCKAICVDLMHGHYGHYCGITKKTIDTLKNMRARPDWCPIVGELPEEHGDLIDRQDAIKEFEPYAGYESNRSNAEWVERINVVLNFMTAVIAAERKDDGK